MMMSRYEEEMDNFEAAITPGEAEELVSRVLEIQPGNAEALVRLLLAIDRVEPSWPMQMSLDHLITAAYSRSEAHTITRQAYLDAVREGRDPVADVRRRFEAIVLASSSSID